MPRTRSNTPRRGSGYHDVGAATALELLQSAFIYLSRSGLAVTATNDAGALVVRIVGGQVIDDGGTMRFVPVNPGGGA